MPEPVLAREAAARWISAATSSSDSGRNWNTVDRLTSALLIAKYGFSVVAPMSVIRAVLDVGEEHVLLVAGEAVQLVDEEDRAAIVLLESPRGIGERSRAPP